MSIFIINKTYLKLKNKIGNFTLKILEKKMKGEFQNIMKFKDNTNNVWRKGLEKRTKSLNLNKTKCV